METITLPLKQYLESLIGDDLNRVVHHEIADILEAKFKNKDVIYVQRKSRTGIELEHPIVWWMHRWRADVESWRHAKLRDDKEREIRWIFEENVQRVARAVTRETAIDGDAARAIAYRKMKRIDKCREFLVREWKVKFATTINDI